MKILVTGGAGFIGSHIVALYTKAGHEVLVIDNLSSGSKKNVDQKAHFEQVDINDPSLHEIIGRFKPEIVNHQAAQIDVRKSVEDPSYDAQVNIVGSLKVFEAARKAGSLKKILFASSGGAAYGDTDTIPTDESVPAKPISPYGIAKVSVEMYLYYYNQIYNIPYIALRYSNVYGPRQNPHGEAGVVAICFQRLLSGKEFVINGDGEQTRDFVFVEDVARASLLALDSEFIGEVNIATSVETSIKSLVHQMATSIEHKDEIPHGPAKTGEQKRSCLDYSKAENELGWKPEVDITTGIAKTAEYFKSNS